MSLLPVKGYDCQQCEDPGCDDIGGSVIHSGNHRFAHLPGVGDPKREDEPDEDGPGNEGETYSACGMFDDGGGGGGGGGRSSKGI